MATTTMDVHYKDENVTVLTDDYVTKDGYRHQQGIFKVVSPHFRTKTFKGETAWSDSLRYAQDELDKAGIRTYLYW